MDILIFQVTQQRFGLETALIREVVRAVWVVPIPRLPPTFDGVLNLRGEMVPLLNLRTLFLLPEKSIDLDEVFIIVELPGRLMAIRAESVEGPVSLSPREVQEGKTLGPQLEYVQALAKTAQGLILLLDPETLPPQGEPVSLEDVLAETLNREIVE